MSNENKKSSTQPIKTEQKKVENQKSETKGAATAPIKAKKKAPIKPTSEDEDVKVYNSDAGKTRIRKAEPKTKKMPVVQKSKEEKAGDRKTKLETAYNALSMDGKVTVGDLAEYLDITEMTVRRYIKEHGDFWIDEGEVGRKKQ